MKNLTQYLSKKGTHVHKYQDEHYAGWSLKLKKNKVVKPYKRCQSQGHIKLNLTEKAGNGRLPSAGRATTVSLFCKEVLSLV